MNLKKDKSTLSISEKLDEPVHPLRIRENVKSKIKKCINFKIV